MPKVWCDGPGEQGREGGGAQEPEWIEWVLFHGRRRAGRVVQAVLAAV